MLSVSYHVVNDIYISVCDVENVMNDVVVVSPKPNIKNEVNNKYINKNLSCPIFLRIKITFNEMKIHKLIHEYCQLPDCVTLLQERPRSIPSTKGNKTEDNSSKPGFFKGLFSRKKPDHVIEKSKDEPTKFPDVVQSKHNVKINKNNKRNEIDKENSNLTDDSNVDDQVNNSEPRCSPSVEEVNARPSDAKKIININGKLEALTLTDGGEIGKRKRKRKKKQNVEADSKDKPSTLVNVLKNIEV